MSEHSLYARAVVHGKVKSDYCTVAPADYCDAGDVEVVEDGDCVAGEVVVVKICEVCVGTASFAAGARTIC